METTFQDRDARLLEGRREGNGTFKFQCFQTGWYISRHMGAHQSFAAKCGDAAGPGRAGPADFGRGGGGCTDAFSVPPTTKRCLRFEWPARQVAEAGRFAARGFDDTPKPLGGCVGCAFLLASCFSDVGSMA